MADVVDALPEIFCVNWFRKDESGQYIWPGFGENVRVLQWIVARCEGKAGAQESAVGWMPRFEDIDWNGLELSQDNFNQLSQLDLSDWNKEVDLQKGWLDSIGDKLPPQLARRQEVLAHTLSAH